MPEVVAGAAFGTARSHGQEGLRTVPGLNLTFSSMQKTTAFRSGLHVKADHIPHFFHKNRIGRKVEALLAVGLQTKDPPNACHTLVRKPTLQRQRANASMGGGSRLGAQGQSDDFRHLLIADFPGNSRPVNIPQSVEPLAAETLRPCSHSLLT